MRKPAAPMIERLSPALRLMGLGWYFVLVIVGGVLGGVGLDSWLGTSPLFTLVGLFGGLMLAFWGGYFLLMEAIGRGRRSNRDNADD